VENGVSKSRSRVILRIICIHVYTHTRKDGLRRRVASNVAWSTGSRRVLGSIPALASRTPF